MSKSLKAKCLKGSSKEGMSCLEQEVFLDIVDLLERNDEFNSLHDDDESTFGGDEADETRLRPLKRASSASFWSRSRWVFHGFAFETPRKHC